MGITFGGIAVLHADPEGELQSWLDRHQPTERSIVYGEHLGRASVSTTTRSHVNGRGLPRLNYPADPPAKVNTLYWPTGATRWSRAFLFADHKAKTEIVEKAYKSNSSTALALKMGDSESGDSISADMYLLPPRPVSGAGTSEEESLWLLPLVDARYFWQFRHVGDITVEYNTSWTTVVSDIGTGLGESVDPGTISEDYLNPDPIELQRKYHNAAIMLDAVAHSLGKRVVRKLEGTVVLESPSDAESVLTENLQGGTNWARSAGDKFDFGKGGELPEKVEVVFRRWANGVIRRDNSYAKEVDSSGVSGMSEAAKITGAKLAIYSTALADYTDGTSDPDNKSKLDTLAGAIASDWYSWRRNRYDYSFVGVKSWESCGYDDHVEFAFGQPRSGGGYGVYTRAQSAAHNFGAEQQLSQDVDCYELQGEVWAKSAEDIPARSDETCGSGQATLWDLDEDGTFTEDATRTPEIHNWTGSECTAEKHFRVKPDPISGLLVVVGEDCA